MMDIIVGTRRGVNEIANGRRLQCAVCEFVAQDFAARGNGAWSWRTEAPLLIASAELLLCLEYLLDMGLIFLK